MTPARDSQAFGTGKLRMRGNLHVGVGFLSATSGAPAERRLRFGRAAGLAYMEAGEGEPVVMIHGLGGTKASFLPTVVALARAGYHAIAIDQPGFGDSHKPLFAAYDAAFMARARDILPRRARHRVGAFVGNSLGGRVALELGLAHPERTRKLALLACSLAWKRRPAWARYLSLARPELGLIQPAPRPVVERIVRGSIPNGAGWAAAGIDEFVRSYCTPRGRAAFYAAARHILLEQSEQFWERLGTLEREALFVWGRQDGIVPDLVRTPRPRGAASGEARRARLRPRSSDRAAGGDRGGAQALPERLNLPANRRWIWRASSSSIARTSAA